MDISLLYTMLGSGGILGLIYLLSNALHNHFKFNIPNINFPIFEKAPPEHPFSVKLGIKNNSESPADLQSYFVEIQEIIPENENKFIDFCKKRPEGGSAGCIYKSGEIYTYLD